MAAITQARHAIFGRRYGSFSGKTVVSWTTIGAIMRFAATALSVAFEATLKATVGSVSARLFNETTATAVSGSEVSTAATSRTRVRSSAVALTDGQEYTAQFGKSGSDAGVAYGASLVQP